MKKIVALALVFSFMTTMVFAEPVVLASRIIQTTDIISEADLNDPLFADVEVPQLAAFEAEQVEGDGVLAAFALGTIGGAVGIMVSCSMYGPVRGYYPAAVVNNGWRVGFTFGFTIGLLAPGL
jgi:hypothetical protein